MRQNSLIIIRQRWITVIICLCPGPFFLHFSMFLLFCHLYTKNTSILNFLLYVCLSFCLSCSVNTDTQLLTGFPSKLSISVTFPYSWLACAVGICLGDEPKRERRKFFSGTGKYNVNWKTSFSCTPLCKDICVCESADKCSPREWPEESEAKLCHLLLQPGTDQSAFSKHLTPPSVSAHSYPPTHWQTGLSSVQKPWWPLWSCHAGGDSPDTVLHSDMLASLFFHPGEDLVSSSLLCVENEIKLWKHLSTETLMPWGIFLRIHWGECGFMFSLECRADTQLETQRG